MRTVLPDERRNPAVDLIKLVFLFIVVVHHSGLASGVLRHGYMVVEGFFMLSGFLLHRSAAAHPQDSVPKLLGRRWKRLYPEYLAAFVLITGYTCACRGCLPWEAGFAPYTAPVGFVLELVLLQNVGLSFGGGLNYPLWYLSVLLPVSALVLYALRHLQRRTGLITALLTVAGCLALLIRGNPGNTEQWGNAFDVLSLPLVRGLWSVTAGALLSVLHGCAGARMAACPALCRSCEAVLAVLCGWLMLQNGTNDYVLAGCIWLLLLFALLPCSLCGMAGRSRPVRCLIPYEYSMFLNHALVITLCRDWIEPYTGYVWCCVITYAVLPLFGAAVRRVVLALAKRA